MKTTNKAIILAGIASLMFIAVLAILPASADAAAQNCTQFASKQCVSNISYWYDSCNQIQAVAQNCNTSGQMCSNGACVNKPGSTGSTGTGGTTYNPGNPYPSTGYIQNYRTYCYQNNVQWYDSRGAVQGVYQACQDANSCSLDTCQDNACRAQLKCDGSTCAVNSADYIKYCQNNVQGATTQNPSTNNPPVQVGQPGQGQPMDQSQAKWIVISLFGKKEGGAGWTKTIDANNNDKLEFLMVVKNISNMPLNNVLAAADVTGNITYTGNLTIDSSTSAGSVVSGIDLGTLNPNTSTAIHFTGTAQAPNTQTVQVVSRVTSANFMDSDSFTANISASATTASVSGSPFIEFIKRWYLWIIIVIVLIALFVIIFRRLSTNP